MKVETAASKSALVLGLSLRKKAFNFDQSISMGFNSGLLVRDC
jgi:hypothetical protein